MQTFWDVRPFSPIDVPLARRLAPVTVGMDSAVRLTRGVNALEGAMLCALPLTDLGAPTFVIRDRDGEYLAQFRHKLGDSHAHIVCMAPDPKTEADGGPWLHLLDSMMMYAGRRHAHILNAEVDEDSYAFEVLRTAGFAVYARQHIWRHSPAAVVWETTTAVRPASEQDMAHIMALYASIVPRLVAQASASPDCYVEGRHSGFVVEHQAKIVGYVAVQEGRFGAYLQPYLHPNACYDQAQSVIGSVIQQLGGADRRPMYICIRPYQAWLSHTLDALNFEIWQREALMARHTVARLEQLSFRLAQMPERAIPAVHNMLGECSQLNSNVGEESHRFNGISYNGRSRETESGLAGLSGGCS